MIAVFSQADATVVVAVVTLIGGPMAALLIRQKRSIEQINKAVNHVGPNEPTLIQRVRDIQADNADFRAWTHESMKAIAMQVGATLTEPPAEHGSGPTPGGKS